MVNIFNLRAFKGVGSASEIDCLNEYLDSLEDYPDYPKIIEALVSGESGSEIPSGISSRDLRD